MAETSSSSEEIPNSSNPSNPANQIVMHQRFRPDFNSSQKLTNVPLNGKNYLPWSKAAKISLKGKGLLGFINGTKSRPTAIREVQEEWDILDGQTITLILNSLEAQMSEMFVFHETAQELWTAIEEQYSQQSNNAAVFRLKQEISKLSQGNKSVSVLIGQIKMKYQELETYRPITTDLAVLRERKEQDRVYDFLAALDPSYDAIRAQILNSTDRLTFAGVAARIQQEETRRAAMNPSDSNPKSEGHAFSAVSSSAGGNNGGGKGKKGSRLKCAHCNREGHLKDGCWILHPHLKPKWKTEGQRGGEAKKANIRDGVRVRVLVRVTGTSPNLSKPMPNSINSLLKWANLLAC